MKLVDDARELLGMGDPPRMQRPDIHTYYLRMATLASTRGTCIRSAVGCVLTDVNNRVLSVGYNGPPKGMEHCTDKPCAGAKAKSGTSLHLCEAIHAEQSALLACKDIDAINSCYVTRSPCVFCTRQLLNTGCLNVYYIAEYPHPKSKQLWKSTGRNWTHIAIE